MADSRELVDTGELRGTLHRPVGPPRGGIALTHGAGGNSESVLLSNLADACAAAGLVVFRYDLPFRVRKPKGPPHPSRAAEDREGVVRAVDWVRTLTSGTVVAAGHSYGGRQSSMAVAENEGLADGLLLLSYPLHPPGKPEKVRTSHFPDIRTPTVFVHGSKDPFGSLPELEAAIELIAASTALVEIIGAGHDLSAAKHRASEQAVAAAREHFDFP